MTEPVPFLVRQIETQLGEGAVWNAQNQQLYFIDIEGKKLHLFDPVSEELKTHDVGLRIGTVVPAGANFAVVALQNGIFHLNLTTGIKTYLANPEKDHKNMQMNNGKCDPSGR